MEIKGWSLGFYRTCEWIMRLAYVNLLWVLFILVGGIVLGVGPSTAAMFAVIRKWIMREDIPVFKSFWRYYRTEFRRANLLGILLIFIGYILFLDIKLFQAQEGLIFLILQYSTIGILIFYAVLLMYIFPVFVHYELKLFHYFRSAILFGLMHPILTILMGVACFAAYNVLIYVPGLLPFFGGSLYSLAMMLFAYKAFSKAELAINNIEQDAQSADEYQMLKGG